MELKIALIFNYERQGTAGSYFQRALDKFAHIAVDHYWTRDAESIEPTYDLYLCIDHGDYKYDAPSYLRPQVFLAIDTHLKKPFKKIVKQSRHYDLVLCAQKDGIRRLTWRNISAQWLPLACDPNIHRKLDVFRKYNIGFVGTDGKKSLRKVLLKELARRYQKSFLGTAPFMEMSRIYSACKIGFNFSIKNDINMRMLEVLSCGALLVTNRIKENGFRDLFEDGKHLVTYRNPKELFRLIDYYLSHDRQREDIARNGHQLVGKFHTYEMRTAKMFDYIKEKLAGNYPWLSKL